jgi:hypothetical protein
MLVVFDCVYLITGTMNRMNIAFVFAFAALATRRAPAAVAMAVGSTVFAFVGYGFGAAVLHRHINPEFSLALVIGYFAALVLPPARSDQPRTAAQAGRTT